MLSFIHVGLFWDNHRLLYATKSVKGRILAPALVAHHGTASALAQAMGQNRKGVASMLLYLAAIPMAFFNAPVAMGLKCWSLRSESFRSGGSSEHRGHEVKQGFVVLIGRLALLLCACATPFGKVPG